MNKKQVLNDLTKAVSMQKMLPETKEKLNYFVDAFFKAFIDEKRIYVKQVKDTIFISIKEGKLEYCVRDGIPRIMRIYIYGYRTRKVVKSDENKRSRQKNANTKTSRTSN
jgi:hypothetical protein